MPVVLCGVIVVVLAGCGGSTAKTGATTTSVRLGTTNRIAPTVAPTVPIGSATTPAPGSPSGTVGSATSPPTTANRSTTVAGRVVTSPSDNVQLGDSGSGVKQIQTALIAQGYKITADGQFGPLTDQAVKSFQAKRGLKQDGIVGPATWAKLQAAPTSATTKPATTTTKA